MDCLKNSADSFLLLEIYDFRVIIGLMQIWFIGRTLASQAGKAGSTPVICFKKPFIYGALQTS